MEVAMIYSQFHQSLLTFIRSRIRSREDAEDILHNIFIKISSHVSDLSDEEKLQSWIFTITRNAITDYYRAKAVRKNLPVDQDAYVVEEEQTDSTKGLDQCIHGMIGLLPLAYRQIIIESELNGVAQKDIAEKYGMAYPTIRSRVQRGRERLKQLFYDCCHIQTNGLGDVLEARGRGCSDPCDSCADDAQENII